jgi:stage II sporulation protein D
MRGVPCPDHGKKSGHGVGLCQYGARAFAEQGRKFDEILKHYYQGVSIELLEK